MLRRATLLAALVAAQALSGCGGDEGPAVDPDPLFGAQPNFVFVLTDDQNLAQYTPKTMPFTSRFMSERGTTFNLHRATTPLCCPSRASMLTGQYGHNHRVLSNVPGWGILDDPDNILPQWLQRVGYQTGYVGKFLNGYEKTVPKHKDAPPYWDEWYGLIGGHGYNDFKVSDNGKKDVHDGDRYLTDNLSKHAVGMVKDFAGDEPFFIQLSQLAPHVENFTAQSRGPCAGDAVPAPHDIGAFNGAGLPNSPALNERDVSDKPTFVTGKTPLSEEQLEQLETRYECRLGSLLAVDRGVEDLVEALEATGELESTVFIFGSDNGVFHGEHRLPGGKGLAFEEASRIPLAISAPSQSRGGAELVAEVDDPTANIDVVPTIVELAGAPTCPAEGECRVMDGRSLVPLLTGDRADYPRNRPILTELNLNAQGVEVGRGISCTFQGVFDGRWAYFHHTLVPDPVLGACAEQEVIEQYDLEADPFQLDNLVVAEMPQSAAAARAAPQLEKLLAELSDCAGIEGRDPEPESGHYCS